MGATPALANKLERVLLCIPHGGLNDTLGQIEKCRRYAKAFDRVLVIDTHRRSGILSHFPDFFEMKDPGGVTVVPQLDESLRRRLNALTCNPAALQNRIGEYVSLYSTERNNVCEKTSGGLNTFDFEKDYEEQLLVNEQCRSGHLAEHLLPRLVLSLRARSEISASLSRLPRPYVGVHVRNTDYRTDYVALFESMYDQVAWKNLLVCSDDAGAISHARSFFRHSVVITATAIPNAVGKPLHRGSTYDSHDERVRATITALTDLLALGCAQEFHYAKIVSDGNRGPTRSGFSLLADHLFRNRHLIESLLGARETAAQEMAAAS
jgi:hypothetical protein